VSWRRLPWTVKPRAWLADGLERVRLGGARIVEATAAATVAWLVAADLLRHEQPFFAPAAALITLGVTRGQRVHRAVEIMLGVAAGVLVADLIARAIGPGTGWSVAVVTALTLVAVVFVGGGPLAVVQGAVSAIYVAVVTPPGAGLVPSRFIDALVGGGVALVVNQLPLDRDPLAALVQDARSLAGELAAVLSETARAVETSDQQAAERALAHARATDPLVNALHAAVEEGFEAARLDPLRRRRLAPLHVYEQAARELDLALRNVRVLARAAVVLTRSGQQAPAPLVPALDHLTAAVRDLGDHLLSAAHPAADTGGAARQARENALRAVRLAGSTLPGGQVLPIVMIVGQVRATAVDLLRGAGLDLAEVLRVTDEALGIARAEEE
jgi:uncharacterized membrane protein YgaE (UPF0421/DUF939 family)